MDSRIADAARALAAGDPLGALNRVALRDDAAALALRGIAMAQIGDFERASALMRGAARAFGPRAPLARARCVVAEGEIALAARDLGWQPHALAAARATLETHGDFANAAHARLVEVRRLLLVGQLDEAEDRLAEFHAAPHAARLPPAFDAIRELATAGIALRRLEARPARTALARAAQAARAAAIPALVAEVAAVARALDTPAGRLISQGAERPLVLDEIEALLLSKAFVVDACRYAVRENGTVVALARRPVLFTLARALAEAWPADAAREALIERAFRTKHPDDSHRARLRVEMGRLRAALRPLAALHATPRGFALAPHAAREVVVLARPIEETHMALLALLADGEAWSSSSLALALGASQRTVQRGLDALAGSGKIQALGRGRARRWTLAPAAAFTTPLLLPALLPNG
ncbi:helix-turn-helix domain-containing protein [Paraburkholderia sp. J12]|uniref:helix-turn-helix domain-containing protein n=1 Tax=Paraburkholderia sp. J12 TaxID=2805432 RepID=UPI002ABD2FB5|nr:helix-turn-helix domain-containing protein [Paraburkholderia sp. J12]